MKKLLKVSLAVASMFLAILTLTGCGIVDEISKKLSEEDNDTTEEYNDTTKGGNKTTEGENKTTENAVEKKLDELAQKSGYQVTYKLADMVVIYGEKGDIIWISLDGEYMAFDGKTSAIYSSEDGTTWEFSSRLADLTPYFSVYKASLTTTLSEYVEYAKKGSGTYASRSCDVYEYSTSAGVIGQYASLTQVIAIDKETGMCMYRKTTTELNGEKEEEVSFEVTEFKTNVNAPNLPEPPKALYEGSEYASQYMDLGDYAMLTGIWDSSALPSVFPKQPDKSTCNYTILTRGTSPTSMYCFDYEGDDLLGYYVTGSAEQESFYTNIKTQLADAGFELFNIVSSDEDVSIYCVLCGYNKDYYVQFTISGSTGEYSYSLAMSNIPYENPTSFSGIAFPNFGFISKKITCEYEKDGEYYHGDLSSVPSCDSWEVSFRVYNCIPEQIRTYIGSLESAGFIASVDYEGDSIYGSLSDNAGEYYISVNFYDGEFSLSIQYTKQN